MFDNTWLIAIDLAAQRAATALGGGSLGFEWAMRMLVTIDLLKMWLPVGLTLYVWLHPDNRLGSRMPFVIRGLLGLVLALALDLLLQETVNRLRPRFAQPDYPFPPYESGWEDNITTSFPSDHAVLAFALTTIIWHRSRALGLVAAAWSVAGICFPRLYFGFHWLSDLVAGAILGVLPVVLMMRLPLPAATWRWAEAFERRSPALATVLAAAICYEFVRSFETVRRGIKIGHDIIHTIGSKLG